MRLRCLGCFLQGGELRHSLAHIWGLKARPPWVAVWWAFYTIASEDRTFWDDVSSSPPEAEGVQCSQGCTRGRPFAAITHNPQGNNTQEGMWENSGGVPASLTPF